MIENNDIVVTLAKKNADHLEEKIGALNNWNEAWWIMKRIPKRNFNIIFITCNGIINYYFTIKKKVFNPEENLYFIYFGDYQKIKPIRMKGFQGFRYRKFNYEVIEELE